MLFDSYLIILVLFEFKSDPLLFLFLFLTYKIFSPLAVLWQVDRIIKINRTESFFSLVFLVFPIFFLFVLLPLLFNSFFFLRTWQIQKPPIVNYCIQNLSFCRSWSEEKNKMSCCFLFLSSVLIASHVHPVFQMDESFFIHKTSPDIATLRMIFAVDTALILTLRSINLGISWAII